MSRTLRVRREEKEVVVPKGVELLDRMSVQEAVLVAMEQVAPRLVKVHDAGLIEPLISENALRNLEEEVEAQASFQADNIEDAIAADNAGTAEEEAPATTVATEKPAGDADSPQLCLCGCGQPVAKRRNFKQGHDAKLHSILRKVEKEELDESAIPEIARPHLAVCSCCGKPILAHESGKGPLCRKGLCKCPKEDS